MAAAAERGRTSMLIHTRTILLCCVILAALQFTVAQSDLCLVGQCSGLGRPLPVSVPKGNIAQHLAYNACVRRAAAAPPPLASAVKLIHLLLLYVYQIIPYVHTYQVAVVSYVLCGTLEQQLDLNGTQPCQCASMYVQASDPNIAYWQQFLVVQYIHSLVFC